MRLRVSTDRGEIDCDIRLEEEVCRATVGRASFELKVQRVEDGVFLLTYKNRTIEVFVVESGPHSEEFTVHINGKSHRLSIHDEKRLQRGTKHSREAVGRVTIAAPMPGKVVRLLVKSGDNVEAGQGLIVVEAMKMQNEMVSPRAGKVAEITVIPGDTVNSGDVLIVIE
jgi:biotin carboxyl carrier protein